MLYTILNNLLEHHYVNIVSSLGCHELIRSVIYICHKFLNSFNYIHTAIYSKLKNIVLDLAFISLFKVQKFDTIIYISFNTSGI